MKLRTESDEFVDSYLIALAFTAQCENDIVREWYSPGADIRDIVSPDGVRQHLAEDDYANIVADCVSFLEANRGDIGDAIEDAAHDFCLTRNRHGAGFWDGDWPSPAVERLTEASHAYGEQSLEVEQTPDGEIAAVRLLN